ncbi:MAG TPA: hypothetical protein VGJ95_16125 [Pseudonocardiaceae bacterium]
MRAPILCVVGEKDRATELYQERYTEWSHFSDDVQLAVIPRAGHYFLKHQATELAAVLTAWAWGAGNGAPPSTTNPLVGGTWSTATTTAWARGNAATPATPASATATAATATAAARPSLRTFAAVAIGQFVSMIGTGLSAFALGV